MTSSLRLQKANTAKQKRERERLNGWRPSDLPLSNEEASDYEAHNERIARGFKAFCEVGESLLDIRNRRLYREEYATFEDYLLHRWDMKQSRAYQLMDAATTIDNLKSSTIVELPQNEAQARPLTSLEPEEQGIVWDVVQQTAINGKVTADHVKSVVTVFKEIVQTRAIDNGEGESIPVSDASLTHLKAAVTEETYERLKRQEAYIQEKQAKRGTPAALLSSDSNEWYTPPVYLDAVRSVLGTIDLDPASNAEANAIVQARAFYDMAANGLKQPWEGRVFLNPPYGKEDGESVSNQALWSARLMSQYEQGVTTEAILLVNAITDAGWFQPLWDYPICFTDHRIPFYRPGGEAGKQPVRGSVFVYFGANVAEFAAVFRHFGAVVLSAVRGEAS